MFTFYQLPYLTLPYLTSCNTALYVNEIFKCDNMKTPNMMHYEMLSQHFFKFVRLELANVRMIKFFICLIQQIKSAFYDERNLVL